MDKNNNKSNKEKKRESIRNRANAIKSFRCKNLIAVLEFPSYIKNIGTVIRNVNALGVEKNYIILPIINPLLMIGRK